MELYDHIIRGLGSLTGASPVRRCPYDPARAWEDTGAFELVMQRDTAFELGGDDKPAVNFTCVTTNRELVDQDEILVVGSDLRQLSGSTPYARIALLLSGGIEIDDETDTERAFHAIQSLDFVKYHVFPKGYMIRTSNESSREQVRISKEALQKGISFEDVGADFIRQYKRNPNVLAVRMLFITAPDADYAALQENARRVHDITMSLTKILEGMPTDCGSCQLKPICDEVEGMRELHFGKAKRRMK